MITVIDACVYLFSYSPESCDPGGVYVKVRVSRPVTPPCDSDTTDEGSSVASAAHTTDVIDMKVGVDVKHILPILAFTSLQGKPDVAVVAGEQSDVLEVSGGDEYLKGYIFP